jgi:hypothetical protein
VHGFHGFNSVGCLCRRGMNFYAIIIHMSIYNVVTKRFRMNKLWLP